MSTTKKRRTASLIVATAVGAGLVGLPLAMSANAAGGAPAYVSQWAVIDTTSTSAVKLVDAHATGNPTLTTQSLGSTKCALDTDGSVIGFTGAGGLNSVGYDTGKIGVQEKPNAKGQSCAAVDSAGGESLTLAMAGGRVAASASLDVDLKQSARILATATLKGKTVAYYELQSGTTEGITTKVPGVDAKLPYLVYPCTNAADSGADSGINDNCRWEISVPSWVGQDDGLFFDTLTLTAVNGSFSLEGGAEGTVVDPEHAMPSYLVDQGLDSTSIFELTDGVLDCNTSTGVVTGSGDVVSTEVYRMGNANGSSCVLVPYTLSGTTGSAQFYKTLGTQTSAQFLWTVDWELAQPGTSSTKVDELKIDFEEGAGANAIGWCPDPLTFGTPGDYTTFQGYTPAQLAAFGDMSPSSTTTIQYACVLARDTKAIGGGKFAEHDLVYVHGDMKLTH